MALGYLIVDLIVNDTSSFLVVLVDTDLSVRVRDIKVFAERVWTWGEKIIGRYLVE